jgi:uncharacterized membrane protein
MGAYEWLKALHVFGGVLLIGNLVVTALWKAALERGGDPTRVRLAAETASRADLAFTLPGALLTFLTGLALVVLREVDLRSERWLLVSMFAFVTMVALWLFYLLPKQRALAEVARRGEVTGTLDPAWVAIVRGWSIVGGIVTALPIVALFLMVLKPF